MRLLSLVTRRITSSAAWHAMYPIAWKVSRVLRQINFAGSSLTERLLARTLCCINIAERNAPERELVTSHEHRLAVGQLSPMRDKNVKVRTSGDTCDHSLSKNSLTVKVLSVELESECDDEHTYIWGIEHFKIQSATACPGSTQSLETVDNFRQRLACTGPTTVVAQQLYYSNWQVTILHRLVHSPGC